MIDLLLTESLLLINWIFSHPLDATDILLMLMSSVIVFLCRYPTIKQASVGTLLIASWVYQIYETGSGHRIAAPSDVLFDALFFLIVVSAGGNIMSVVVIGNLKAKFKALAGALRRGNAK